jgi:hypothetical protein
MRPSSWFICPGGGSPLRVHPTKLGNCGNACKCNNYYTDLHPPGLTLATFQWGAASLLPGPSTPQPTSTFTRLAQLRRHWIAPKVASLPQRQIMSSVTTYGNSRCGQRRVGGCRGGAGRQDCRAWRQGPRGGAGKQHLWRKMLLRRRFWVKYCYKIIILGAGGGP